MLFLPRKANLATLCVSPYSIAIRSLDNCTKKLFRGRLIGFYSIPPHLFSSIFKVMRHRDWLAATGHHCLCVYVCVCVCVCVYVCECVFNCVHNCQHFLTHCCPCMLHYLNNEMGKSILWTNCNWFHDTFDTRF